ncbi:hypothetical protein VP1G_02666 [Cytospora mali]|uniref:Uncharacterized protein n=1 Tax=Cytospora mali TaxID=578113 RepID=A0A194UU86_CYTMA|nr:hypothetical protein VP1G_02666 [Valsa mali var. pyri (nom. inval.)]
MRLITSSPTANVILDHHHDHFPYQARVPTTMQKPTTPIFLLTLLLTPLSLAAGSPPLSPRQSLTPPAECDVIPTWEVTTFNWFNSSDNLDCVSEVDVPDVCFNSTPSGALVGCDGNLGPCEECGVYGCDTGLPLQPAGYGPPDTITIDIPSVPGYETCYESNPQGIRRFEVGDGTLICAGVAYHIDFIGDSNEEVSTGYIDFAPIQSWDCNNGSTITASGSVDFEITCSRDAGNNATCVIPEGETVVIPVLSYTIS